MQRREIPLTGPAYQHRSLPVSAQTCRNWYPEVVSESPYQAVLASPWGSRQFVVNPPNNTRDRGMHIFQGALYKVSGGRLYRCSSAGALTHIGDISGTRRCVFASNAYEMVIVTSGLVYRYNGTALILSPNPMFEQPNAVAYLNNQAIYDGAGSRFVVSSPGNLVGINGLNYAAAESSGDDLLRPYVYQQTLYLMGTDTIESWYNSGVGNPPFARIDGGIVQVGLGALYSPAHNASGVFFLASDRSVRLLNGALAQPISTVPLAQEIIGYSRIDDAIGFCYSVDNQDFYQLVFPTENKTWTYNQQSRAWFEKTSGGDAHIATSYVFWNGRHLIGHRQYILEMRPDVYVDREHRDGYGNYPPELPIIRERVTAQLNGNLLGWPGRETHMGRLELQFEAGQGRAVGQGENPEVTMSFSDDAGVTWSNEQRGDIGRMGKYLLSASWHGLGQFGSRVVRFRVSDPVRCTLLAANADVEACI